VRAEERETIAALARRMMRRGMDADARAWVYAMDRAREQYPSAILTRQQRETLRSLAAKYLDHPGEG
jgi:hypothetical protein